MFSQFHFGILTINTIIVSFIVVALSLSLGGAAAYGLSRHPFFGSNILFHAILITRLITPASFVLPLYLMMDTLRLTNNIIALAIGITVLNLPFVIWILKPFFNSLPREIEEAAQLDGLGPAGIFWRFAITLAGPGFKTVALFSFISASTDLLIPITMSTRPEGWTLTAGIVQMQTDTRKSMQISPDGGRALPHTAELRHRDCHAEVADERLENHVLGHSRVVPAGRARGGNGLAQPRAGVEAE